MAGITDFKALQEQIQAALIAATKTTGTLSAEDLSFQRSLNREIGPALDEQSERVLGLANALLKSAASIADLRVPVLQDVEDVDNDWRGVVDVVDSLLEKADTALYEYTGVIKRQEGAATDSAAKQRKNPAAGNPFRTQNLVKPQLAFEVKPDNFDDSPWKPLLSTKPHAIQSLEDSLGTFTNEFNQKQHRHPYENEIVNLKYPETVYTKSDPIRYLPIDSTSAIFVDTEEAVLEMLEELKTASEIAVDLEHHDARSFVGLVSLMQISTRNKDWIVDTLKPWRQKLQVLNEVFTDPKIVKVFHGAFMDIVWLQRDLGLYVVGLFDTHHASRSLGYAGGSLAFLLKKFINFDADKKYQLADWRIRPLPEEMFFYARSDTHFLLFIYDNIRNELLDRSNPEVSDENRIEIVLDKSKETALLRYERQIYHADSGKGPGGWYQPLVKTLAMFNKEQFSVYRAVHEWRDHVARQDDDSCNSVMPIHVVFSVAKHIPQDLIALLSVVPHASYNVKSRAQELLEVVKKAQVEGPNGPSLMDVLRPDSVGATVKSSLPHVATSKKSPPVSLLQDVDESQLRSEKSNFWGGAFGSSIWESPNSNIVLEDSITLTIPFPSVASVANTSSSTPIISSPQQHIPLKREASPTPLSKNEQTDVAFTLRRGQHESNAKRKSKDMSKDSTSVASTPEEDNELSEEDPDKVTMTIVKRRRSDEKRKARAAKRAEKEAKKTALAEQARDRNNGEQEEEDAPFDYSAAPRVTEVNKSDKMKRKKDKKGKKGSGGKQEPFDPYQKSADAAKGMRRVQTERAGRSATFKN